jgi:hypothetical protein
MSNRPEVDPRDAAYQAERALLGLRLLVGMAPTDDDIPVSALSPLLDIIHDRLEPAIDALQNYLPRT